jgi:hypothetical protein
MVDLCSRWFAVIQAAPIPELGERVNVALLVGDGVAEELFYLQGLPRLVGLATPGERQAVEAMLESTRDWLAGGKSVDEIAARVGPQLNVSSPQLLFTPVSREILATLKASYLEAAGSGELVARETGARWRAERKIDELLGGALPAVGVKLLHRATPRQIFPDAEERVFHSPVPAIARAVRLGPLDYLVDGVIVEPGHVTSAVTAATTRIDRAFWHYRTAKDDLRRVYGRGVVTVGLLFDGGRSADREVAEAVDYVRHIWGYHADHILDGAKQEQRAALRSLMGSGGLSSSRLLRE